MIDTVRITSERGTGARPGLMLTTCCVSIAVIMGLTSGAMAVVPAIGLDIGGDQSQLQWATDVFPVVVAALLLPAGALLDRYGRRRGMLIGLVILTGSVLWTGAADSIEAVIVSRVLAGIGAALLFPGTLATITAVVPTARRTFAVALWATSVVAGAVFGLVIFATAADLWSWRWAFLIVAALTFVLTVLTWAVVPETRAEDEVVLDPVGAVTSVIAIGGLVLAVTEAPVHGWLGPRTLVPGLVGLLVLIVFVRWELRHRHPLLDVRLLMDARFGAGCATLFFAFFAHFAMYFLAIQYLIYVLGWSTLHAAFGVALPAMGMATTPLGPVLSRRFGRRIVIVAAMAVCVLGALVCVAMAASGGRDYWTFAVGAGLLWSGVATAMAPPTEMITEAVPDEKQGVASAVNDLARELAAAAGIAVCGSMFNTFYRASVEDRTALLPADVGELALASPGAALAAAGRTPDPALTVDVVQDGILAGWNGALTMTAIVTMLGAVLVWRRCPSLSEERASKVTLNETRHRPAG